MTIVEIEKMSDEELMNQLNEAVRRCQINGSMDDDTVLYQQLYSEVRRRLNFYELHVANSDAHRGK